MDTKRCGHLATGYRGVGSGRRRPVVAGAAVAALAGALVLAGTGPASAAAPIKVNCDAGANLQDAINSAPSGATLLLTGTCTPLTGGNFGVQKDLSLKGQGTAVLTNPKLGTLFTAATVNLTNLTITGGGIFNVGTLTLRDSRVTNNTNARGITNVGGSVRLYDTPVTNNHDIGSGAGIATSGPLTLNDSPVTGNHGASGGGIRAYGTTVTLNDSPVTNNTADFGGGGIETAGGATVILHDSPVTGNTPDNCAPSGSVPRCFG
jgi:hypothetical protein